jgi:hypothetical protein
MNIKQLVTIIFAFSLSALFSVSTFAQENTAQIPADSAPTTPQAPSEPVTGYQGMLPYIQENAAIRKEAKQKYASEKSRKKSKKSKMKSASKKKSRTSASVKKSGGKAKSKKKKSPSSH